VIHQAYVATARFQRDEQRVERLARTLQRAAHLAQGEEDSSIIPPLYVRQARALLCMESLRHELLEALSAS
jgi:hypothetical protein